MRDEACVPTAGDSIAFFVVPLVSALVENAGSRGPSSRRRCDEPFKRVVDVLNLLAGQRIDLGGAGDTLDEGDNLVAIDATRRKNKTCRACQAEHPADLALRGGPGVAARAEPQERRVVELNRLRRDALVKEHAQQRRSCEHVVQGIVRLLEHDAAPRADRLQAMIRRERFEQPERVERARDPDRAVIDPGARERVLKHRQVERALCATNTAPSSSPRSSSAISSKRGAEATSSSLMPCTAVASAGIGHDGRTSRAKPGGLDAVGVEPDEGERDDLVPTGRRPGRLAVEHRVGQRRRYVLAPDARSLGRPPIAAETDMYQPCRPSRTAILRSRCRLLTCDLDGGARRKGSQGSARAVNHDPLLDLPRFPRTATDEVSH